MTLDDAIHEARNRWIAGTAWLTDREKRFGPICHVGIEKSTRTEVVPVSYGSGQSFEEAFTAAERNGHQRDM